MTVPAVPRRLRVGANYNCYGNALGLWFGPLPADIPPSYRPFTDTGDEKMRQEWRQSFPVTISRLAAMGISVLRIWLLGNAFNYGTTHRPMQPPPPPPDGEAWTNSYALHLDELLGFCETANLKVILVLVVHGAFFMGDGGGYGNKEALALVPAIRDDFFRRVFEPMLAVSDNYRKTVWAWEPINEPNWATQYWLSDLLVPTSPGSPNPPTFWPAIPVVPRADMQTFLDEATRRILAHGHNVTHGFSFGLGCRLVLPPEVGLLLDTIQPLPVPDTNISIADENVFEVNAPDSRYVRQFHYYPFRFSVPIPPFGRRTYDIRNDLPNHGASRAILGEISTRQPDPAREAREQEYAAWRSLGGRDVASVTDAVYYRLVLAEQLGYDHAILWPNNEEWNGVAEPILTDAALEGVWRFLNEPKLPRL